MEHVISNYDSPFGRMLISAEGDALTGLWFYKGRYFAEGLAEDSEEKEIPLFEDTRNWLDIYFSGRNPGFTPKLLIKDSPFRKRVCEIMLEIPYGSTLTYGDIAKRIAFEQGKSRMSAQAVGGAVGHNPISLIVPCHRVVGAGGNLTGYGGGLYTKLALLKLEGLNTEEFYMPKACCKQSLSDN